jgi:AcrR family transcriptional regulator
MTPLSGILAAGEEQLDPYSERILDAARDQFRTYGLRRTSIDDIAHAAGVGRATVFRRFANRDALLGASAVREARRMIAAVDAQIASIDDPEERVVTGFVALIGEITGNELLRRLLRSDQEQVLPMLTLHGDAVLALGREYIAGVVRRARGERPTVAGEVDEVAELLARFALSLAVNRRSVLPLNDQQGLRRFARATIVPLALGA